LEGALLDQLIHVHVRAHPQRAVGERTPEQLQRALPNGFLRRGALDLCDKLDRVCERAGRPRAAGVGPIGVNVEVGESGQREPRSLRVDGTDRRDLPVSDVQLESAGRTRQHHGAERHYS